MLYGAEMWATTQKHEKRIEANAMKMLRWMRGVTRKYKIRNEHIRVTARVAQASKKITERWLSWYGHGMRKDDEHIPRKVLRMDKPGIREATENKMERRVSTRLARYWTESGRGDGWVMWRRKIISYIGDPAWREQPGDKKKKNLSAMQLFVEGRFDCSQSAMLCPIYMAGPTCRAGTDTISGLFWCQLIGPKPKLLSYCIFHVPHYMHG